MKAKKDELEEVVLPVLDVPFPSAVSRHAEVVHNGTVEWLDRSGVFADEAAYRRFRATNIGWLAARFHPDASRDALQLVSDWYGWMFFRDDQRDESEIGHQPARLAVENARLLEVLKGGAPPAKGEAMEHALADLRERMLTVVSADAWVRLVKSIAEHFDSTVWEANNRLRGVTPDVETYIGMRPITGGLNVDTEFIEVAEHTRLLPEMRKHPLVSMMSRASNNVVCWANDIFSLEKEIRRGDVHNLVLVLQHTQGLGLQEALDRAAGMHDAEVRSFIDMEKRLPPFSGPEAANLERFIGVLRTRMRGFLDWARESGRYRATGIAPPQGGSS